MLVSDQERISGLEVTVCDLQIRPKGPALSAYGFHRTRCGDVVQRLEQSASSRRQYCYRAFVCSVTANGASNVELARKLEELESKYDHQFKIVFSAIRELMTPAPPTPKRIGFRPVALKK